jgi:hypothetical protein
VTGTPLAGESWSLPLGGRPSAVTVGAATDTLEEIATALAAAIRLDNTLEGLVARFARAIDARPGYDASATGTVLSITRAGGAITAAAKNGVGNRVAQSGAAAATVTLDFAGASILHGETWTVEISQAGTTTVITEVAFDRYSAAAEGARVLVSDLSGAPFTPQLAVTPVAAPFDDSTAVAFRDLLDSNVTTGHV